MQTLITFLPTLNAMVIGLASGALVGAFAGAWSGRRLAREIREAHLPRQRDLAAHIERETAETIALMNEKGITLREAIEQLQARTAELRADQGVKS